MAETKKRGRPTKLKAVDLINAGYAYKIDILTDQERNWMQNGIPVEGKPNVRKPAPDYFYYFKEVDGVEVKIMVVGKKNFYTEDGAQIKYASSIPKVEALAKDNQKWKDFASRVIDTPPKKESDFADVVVSVDKLPAEKATLNELFEAAELQPGHIMLVGGPLNGKQVKYNNVFGMYMAQLEGGAPRYKRDKENKSIYHYDKTL